jgi:membrane protein DedA with SNARE-associated domain
MASTNEQPEFVSRADKGATVETVYVKRQIVAYAVFETEVASISSLNAQTTVFFSIASALVSFAAGIWANALFSEKLTAAGEVAAYIGAPLLVVIAVVFAGLGYHAFKTRKSQVEDIRRQSEAKTK